MRNLSSTENKGIEHSVNFVSFVLLSNALLPQVKQLNPDVLQKCEDFVMLCATECENILDMKHRKECADAHYRKCAAECKSMLAE
jgi:hypothetical protein